MATPDQPVGKTAPAVGVVLGSGMLLAFLALWESSGSAVLTVYADRLAGGIPTVCNGITRHVTATPIVLGHRWTHEQCVLEESAALTRLQTQLRRCFSHEPPQSVFDAASSHAWNLGTQSTCNSAAMKAWNRADYPLGCRRLYESDAGTPVWSYVKTGRRLANGQPEYRFVRGLQNRRRAEAAMCLRDVA